MPIASRAYINFVTHYWASLSFLLLWNPYVDAHTDVNVPINRFNPPQYQLRLVISAWCSNSSYVVRSITYMMWAFHMPAHYRVVIINGCWPYPLRKSSFYWCMKYFTRVTHGTVIILICTPYAVHIFYFISLETHPRCHATRDNAFKSCVMSFKYEQLLEPRRKLYVQEFPYWCDAASI